MLEHNLDGTRDMASQHHTPAPAVRSPSFGIHLRHASGTPPLDTWIGNCHGPGFVRPVPPPRVSSRRPTPQTPPASQDGDDGEEGVDSPYREDMETIREMEYPHMRKGIYLDHSGTTIYPASLISAFAASMTANLYGNPHSANEPARLSGAVVDSVRLQTLRFLGADPAHFDLIFVANATAAIKLVADAFRDLAEKSRAADFWYGYHRDAHTSLVGVRELTRRGGRCFLGDADVERWLADAGGSKGRGELGLFAWPGQSNMTGRRLPTTAWAGRLRRGRPNTYSLLDAAALATTAPLDDVFADVDSAPDFTCLSFYKIFGFPDLGGLVVRRRSGHVLALRRYFGGGTVTMVGAVGGAWHRSKGLEAAAAATATHGSGSSSGGYDIHDGVEDGTLPFHSILALGQAIDAHLRLYGSMANVSRHTGALARRLYEGLAGLRHPGGAPACRVYCEDGGRGFGDARLQGATVAFNVLRRDGGHVPYSEVEEAANRRGIYVRSGGICCPGGMFTALDYEPWELERAMSAGHQCGPGGLDVINELPTGVVRASLGAMSTAREVDAFVDFLRETFVRGPQHQQQAVHDEMLVCEPKQTRPHAQIQAVLASFG